MARILQAFHANPALGGFGNESGGSFQGSSSVQEGDCDAFAQIVKELVDNAVDACRGANDIRRVRVDFAQVSPAVLRVTVSDNGCGMACIQDCVEAFRSSKGADKRNNNHHNKSKAGDQTAGRYGIGLTLCLLHAQRLVPNSTASITSAVKEASHFERADYVVDPRQDTVQCIHQEKMPKSRPDESGTSVSILVPGGPMAHRAWPRLAEYFARFQLSLGLPCSLQVMAPTLSTVPLFVRSPLERRQNSATPQRTKNSTLSRSKAAQRSTDADEDSAENEDVWKLDGVDSDSNMDDSSLDGASNNQQESIHREIQRAISSYLKRNIDIRNVAHSIQPIRNAEKRRNTKNSPTLEVDLVVYSEPEGDELEDEKPENLPQSGSNKTAMPMAKMTLIRMVNRIPLLDGAEAAACGLVQGVISKQSMWTSFGLAVSQGTDLTAQDLRLFVPTYQVKDADNVASFFHRSPHQLFEASGEGTEKEHGTQEDEDACAEEGNEGGRRESQKHMSILLPAHLRLGNLLLIVQIHAKPSSLPLPTLSKSRLPLNDSAIITALETGVMECLQSLQKTNPSLLLTPKQLKATVRDTRYIPAASAAIACVLCKSNDRNFQKHFVNMILNWRQSGEAADTTKPLTSEDKGSDKNLLHVTILGPMVETKLRCVIADEDEGKLNAKKRTKEKSLAGVVRTRSQSRSNNKENKAPPDSPTRRQSSDSWGAISPSPVKTSYKRAKAEDSMDAMSADSLGSNMNQSRCVEDEPFSFSQSHSHLAPQLTNNQLNGLTQSQEVNDVDDEWW